MNKALANHTDNCEKLTALEVFDEIRDMRMELKELILFGGEGYDEFQVTLLSHKLQLSIQNFKRRTLYPVWIGTGIIDDKCILQMDLEIRAIDSYPTQKSYRKTPPKPQVQLSGSSVVPLNNHQVIGGTRVGNSIFS